MEQREVDEAYRAAEHAGWRLVHRPPANPARETLCGHVHELWMPRGKPECPTINVGVDVRDYRPRTLEEMAAGVWPPDPLEEYSQTKGSLQTGKPRRA